MLQTVLTKNKLNRGNHVPHGQTNPDHILLREKKEFNFVKFIHIGLHKLSLPTHASEKYEICTGFDGVSTASIRSYRCIIVGQRIRRPYKLHGSQSCGSVLMWTTPQVVTDVLISRTSLQTP